MSPVMIFPGKRGGLRRGRVAVAVASYTQACMQMCKVSYLNEICIIHQRKSFHISPDSKDRGAWFYLPSCTRKEPESNMFTWEILFAYCIWSYF